MVSLHNNGFLLYSLQLLLYFYRKFSDYCHLESHKMALMEINFKLINYKSHIVILKVRKVDLDNGFQEDKKSKTKLKYD